MNKFFAIVLLLVTAMMFGGCTAFPQNRITVVNNTLHWIDVEANGIMKVEKLPPGGTHSINLFNLYENGNIVLVARGFDPYDGPYEGGVVHTDFGGGKWVYVGMYDRTFRLTTGYRGQQFKAQAWEVERLDPPSRVRRTYSR